MLGGKKYLINQRVTDIFNQMISENPWWSGQLLLPNTLAYDQAVPIFNKRVQTYPCLIIQPRNTYEAALVLSYAWKHNIRLRIRGGGHSAEGYSSWNGVQLDTRLMCGMELHADEQTIRLEAGVLWRDVYEILDGTGLAAIGALIPSVGVMGFITGGGFNHFLSRNWGMGCDNALSFTVILHDGTILENVSEDHHGDLWWALRGSGGNNFGLITDVTIKLHPAGGDGADQYYTYTSYYHNTDRDTSLALMNAWHQWTISLLEHDEFRMGTNLEYDPQGTVRMRMVWSGGLATQLIFEQYLRDWQSHTPKATEEEQELKTWLEFAKSERLSWDLTCPYAKPWYGPSAFFQDISPETIDAILDEHQSVTTLLLEAGNTAKRDTWCKNAAFPHRHGQYLISPIFFGDNTSEDAVIWEHGKSFLEHLAQTPYWVGSYINYIDAQITDWVKAYYGDLLPRLQQVKAKYDPHSYWQFPQSIPPHTTSLLPLLPQENNMAPVVQELLAILRSHSTIYQQLVEIWARHMQPEKTFVTVFDALLHMVEHLNNWLYIQPNYSDKFSDKFVEQNSFASFYQTIKEQIIFQQEPLKCWLSNAVQAKTDFMNQNGESSQIDVMMPVAHKDMDMLELAINQLVKHSKNKIRHIYVVWQGNKNEENSDPITVNLEGLHQPKVIFIHEHIYPFNLHQIKKLLQSQDSSYNHGEWYYQQLLKLYAFRILPNVLPRLLIHDVDITFTQPIAFIDEQGRSLLAYGYPFHWLIGVDSPTAYGSIQNVDHSHVDHAQRLVPDWQLANIFSGMQHHQLIERDILESMLQKTEATHNMPFWQAFIQQVDTSKWNSASEYILYFHYACTHYPERVSVRHLQGIDIIHDADEAFTDSWETIANGKQTNIIGRHRFVSLKERLNTMDYIPKNLRHKILSEECNRLAFRLELHEGILNIEAW